MKYIITLLLAYFINSTTISGVYENLVNKEVDYSLLDDDNKMIGFPWEDFKIKNGEKIKKVMVFISTTKNFLGEWHGAFGTSTKVEPDYWYMTGDMSKPFTSKTGKITWEITNSTSEIIELEYGGELKWGVWYIDCIEFTIDKVVVFTDAYEGGYEDEAEEETDEKKAEKIDEGIYKAEIGENYILKELGEDNRMLPINWALFTIPKNETITKIKITLSTTDSELGNWVGAFGSATGIPPDYWIMTKDMSKFLKGTNDFVIWKLTTDEAKAVQSQTNGQLKIGIWSIDCNTFTIETCTIYTDAASDEGEEEEKEEKEKEKKEEKNKNNNSLTPGQRFGIAFLIIIGVILLLFGLCMLRRYIKLKHANEI